MRTRVHESNLRARAHWCLAVLSILGAVAIAQGAQAETADALCTTKLQTIDINADRFKNYDFQSQNDAPCNVDWPVDFIWWNNGEVDHVKNIMDGEGYILPGSQMDERVDDGGGWQWDQDGGRKNDQCFGADADHFRLYAPADDRFYNMDWGYYVIATAHIDHNECGPSGTWFGKSEGAEADIAQDARDEIGGWRVDEDARFLHNDHDYRREGDHILNNNGYATKVQVP